MNTYTNRYESWQPKSDNQPKRRVFPSNWVAVALCNILIFSHIWLDWKPSSWDKARQLRKIHTVIITAIGSYFNATELNVD